MDRKFCSGHLLRRDQLCVPNPHTNGLERLDALEGLVLVDAGVDEG